MLLLPMLLATGRGAAQESVDDPPVVGRPEGTFSGIVGQYRIEAEAQPGKIALEEPITLAVRIVGRGPAKYQPKRENLKIFPEILEVDFYVEPVPESDRVIASQNTWEFVYRLRPKRTDVTEIPPLRLVYYAPPARRYQTTYCESMPIEVTPSVVETPKVEGLKTIKAPESFYRFREDGILERQTIKTYWSWPWLTLLLVGPPLVGVGWYGWRRWRHPDAATRLKRTQSGAARQAQKALKERGLTHIPRRTSQVLADYLRQRLGFSGQQPSPAEVAQFLWRRGCSKELCREWQRLLQECDAFCYQRLEPHGVERLAEEGDGLIARVEDEVCV